MPITIAKEHPKRESTVLKAKLQLFVTCNPNLLRLTFPILFVTSIISCGCSWKEFTVLYNVIASRHLSFEIVLAYSAWTKYKRVSLGASYMYMFVNLSYSKN